MWNDYATGGNLLDGYQYTYNLQGDVASKQNLYKTAYPTSTAPYLDESYTYDSQDQLLSLTRGQLNTANDLVFANTATFQQNWTLDGMGNWANYTVEQGTGGNLTPSVDQDRTASAANEIQGLSQTVGNWAAPQYDNGSDGDGNMTTVPQPGSEATGLTCV